MGITKGSVELTPFGGMIDAEGFEKLSPCRQALCAAAGVGGSLLGAWCCMAFLKQTSFGFDLFQCHLSLGVVNCLPAWPLDGARMLLALAAAFGKEHVMRKCLCWLSRALGCALVGLGLYGAWKGQLNLSLLCAGPYLMYAARQGSVANQLRKLRGGLPKDLSQQWLPVHLFASSRPNVASSFPAWMGQWESNRYHMLCEMNEDGQVKHFWTEDEICQRVFGKD